MSRYIEKDSPQNPEIERLLHRCADLRTISSKDVKDHSLVHGCPVLRCAGQDVSSRTSCQDASMESSRTEPMIDPSNRGTTTTAPPSIVVNDVDGNVDVHEDDDEPPPYTVIAPPNHVGWTFDFASGIPYSVCTAPFCGAEAPLAPFQTPLASGATYNPEGAIGQRQSIAVPLAPPYRFFKLGSHGSLYMQRASPMPESRSTTKCIFGKTRKYGAILVAGAVIVFLMILSLLVRFVVERSFWRG